MKIRMHRGGLADSLATVQEIEPTTSAVAQYLRAHGLPDEGNVSFVYYGRDERIGWLDTRAIEFDGRIVAFSNALPREFYE